MAGKTTDRKNKLKELKNASEAVDAVAAFALPESLAASEIDFPVLIKRKSLASWDAILEESQENNKERQNYIASKKPQDPKSPFQNTESDYIQRQVFVHLLPALEETLNKAEIWEALRLQKCFFNGLDHIAQVLWTNNPRHPDRKFSNLHIFNMPWVRNYLRDNPRPYYPKSWLWPEDYAATVIQKTVRQYFVQREAEVQEMRDFWKKLEIERHAPEMETNPLLAKKFAEESNH